MSDLIRVNAGTAGAGKFNCTAAQVITLSCDTGTTWAWSLVDGPDAPAFSAPTANSTTLTLGASSVSEGQAYVVKLVKDLGLVTESTDVVILGVPQTSLSWIIPAYGVTKTVTDLSTGWANTTWGMKRILTDVMRYMKNTFTAARGNIPFKGATEWQALAPGVAGQVLSTNGAGADPSWLTVSSELLNKWNEADVTQIAANISSRTVTLPTAHTWNSNVAYSRVVTPAGPAIRIVPTNTFDGRDIRPIFTGLTGTRWVCRFGIANMANYNTGAAPRVGVTFCNGASGSSFRGITLSIAQAAGGTVQVARDLGLSIEFNEGDAKRFDFTGPNIPTNTQAVTWFEFELVTQDNVFNTLNEFSGSVRGYSKGAAAVDTSFAGVDLTVGATYPTGYPTWENSWSVNTLAISLQNIATQTGPTIDLVGLQLLKHPMDL